MMGAVLWSSEGGSLSLLWRPVSRQVVGLGGRESCGRVKETRAQKTTNELTCWRKKRTKKKNESESFSGRKGKKKKRSLSWWNGHATLKSLLLHFNPTRTEEPRNFCFLGVFTFFFLFFFFVIFKKFPPRGCKRDSAYEAKICIDDFFHFVTTFAPFIIYERAVCKLKK